MKVFNFCLDEEEDWFITHLLKNSFTLLYFKSSKLILHN